MICNRAWTIRNFWATRWKEIAQAKAGIIKPGCSAVLYRGSPSVEAVFEEACKARGVELCKADFSALVSRSHSFAGQVFDFGSRKALEIPLLGPINCAMPPWC